MANLIPGETLRVLLVSAEEQARDAVGEALAGRAGDHRLFWVSQPELAAGRIQDLVPHVILVDDDLRGASQPPLIAQLAQRIPGSAVLALVQAGAMGDARQAVLAGARGFVTKPLQADDLINALRQVVAQKRGMAIQAEAEAPANGRVVAFCAPKGGTGRTTLAANTAIMLGQVSKQSVVVLDADYAAPALDVVLNLSPYRNIADLLERISSLDREMVKSVLAPHASGIQVLLAPPPADLSSPISLPQVQQVLVWLKRMYDWVIVDLGLPLDETSYAFLDGADRIVMSVLPEMVGLRNTRLMLDQLHERGYPDDKVWLVINRATMRGGVSLRDIEERLRVQVRHTIPDDQPLATHTVNRGVPLVLSHPHSAVARAIRQFAGELARETAGEVRQEGPADAAGRLLGGLRRRIGPARASG